MIDTIICGDALDVMAGMDSQSVRVAITSPPYWGLRDYGLDPVVWDGDPECEHEWNGNTECPTKIGRQGSTEYGKYPRLVDEMATPKPGSFCSVCGAWLGCLGLEPSPELYVDHLVQIFREIKRILRKDGTLWLNIGDSYWGGKGRSGYELPHEAAERNAKGETFQNSHNVPGYMDMRPSDGRHHVIKPKDMVLIPFRLVLALQADGWWVRSDIIWHKPNCMPSSVKDRPTTDFEHVFLLAKSKKYYYDADAIREPHKQESIDRVRKGYNGKFLSRTREADPREIREGGIDGNNVNPAGRNKRTVWTIPTKPYPEAHFATFPPKLIEPMILAGSAEGDVVFDPFAGSGTTCAVAKAHGRHWIGIEANEEYCELASKRIQETQSQLKLDL